MSSLVALLDRLNLHDSHEEDLNWLPNTNEDAYDLSKESLCNWQRIDKANYSCEGEYLFCEPPLLDEYIQLAIVWEKTGEKPLGLNLFDGVHKLSFSSRSGIKFANLDALVNFSNPLDPNGEPLVAPDHPINYVDITSMDYGFTEYMQWRKGKLARGFAFDNSLMDYNIWANAGECRPESELIRHVNGPTKDYSVIRSFIEFVRSHLIDGAHLVCSDGLECEDKPGAVGIMEKLIKRYLMRQCIIGLATVADKGTFIIKLNNLVTPFMVGLVYLMHLHFREMTIIKPITSRNSNSEAYAVFRSKLPRDTKRLQEHLMNVDESMDRMTDRDIVELVPLDVLRSDGAFFQYIVDCNNRKIRRQIPALTNCIDRKTPINNIVKEQVWSHCFRMWDLPDFGELTEPDRYLLQLIKSAKLNCEIVELTFDNFDSYLRKESMSLWYFAEMSRCQSEHMPTYFLGQGGNVVYMLNGGTWKRLPNDAITLPAGTLVYGQLTDEFHTQNDRVAPSSSVTLHLIDVHTKEFYNVYFKPISFRQQCLQDLVDRGKNDYIRFRPTKGIAQLPEFVVKTRQNWQKFPEHENDRLVFRQPLRRSFYEACGLLLIPDRRGHVGRTRLLWDWSLNTEDVINGKGGQLHLGRFEELLLRPNNATTGRSPRRPPTSVGWRSGKTSASFF